LLRVLCESQDDAFSLDHDRSPHAAAVLGQPLQQLLAFQPFGLGALFRCDQLTLAAGLRGQLAQLVGGERLLDDVAEREFLFTDLVREKLPRFDAAGSTRLPNELDLGWHRRFIQ
jgi:hypothetical protein